MQEIGFDIISDLNLNPNDSFNWENKATSLYCIVAGNISNDMRTVIQVLMHLAIKYQGVFFVPGRLEYENCESIKRRTDELNAIATGIPNVVMLHHNVIVIDGVAILGTNGWENIGKDITAYNLIMASARHEDFSYLYKCLGKLQRHLDVKKIVIVTSAVPHDNLYFGERPDDLSDQIPLCEVIEADTEHKVTHWVFGTYEKNVDTVIDNINYINNPYNHVMPYYAKRLPILI